MVVLLMPFTAGGVGLPLRGARSGACWGLYLGVLLLDVELFSSGQPIAVGTALPSGFRRCPDQ